MYDNSINYVNRLPHSINSSLVAVVIFSISSLEIRILSYWDFNALGSKGLAQWRTLANPRKFLGRINIKYLAKAGRQYRSPSSVYS